MVQPINQGEILASGRALVPDYAAQLMRERLMGIQEQQAQTESTRVAAAVEQQQRENRDEEEMRAALGRLGENPNPAALAELMMRYPRFSEAISRGVQTMDKARQATDVQQLSEAHAAARGGHFDIAANVLEQREAADREAGHEPDPITESVIRGLRSPDPAEQRYAVDALERLTAASVGPEHYASVYGTFSRNTGEMNGIIYDKDTGEALFQDPRGRLVPGSNGSFYRVAPIEGVPFIGGAQSPGTIGESGAVTGEGAVTSGAGETVAPPASGSGRGAANPRSAASVNNPGGLRVSDWTRAQPGFAGTGPNGYARFETPQHGIAAQERLLRGSYLNRPTTLRRVVRRYAPPRSAGGDNSEESVNNYIAYAARRLGISPDQTIDATMTSQLAQAMREFETGRRGRGRIASAETPHVSSRQQYARLPSGARYIAPDGTIRTKP